MTKHEVDVIGGLNMTDQISNEAYKKIMIAAQDENEVNDVLINIRDEIDAIRPDDYPCNMRIPERIRDMAVEIVEKYMGDDDK